MRKNPSWWRHKTKCARGAWHEKTRFVQGEIRHDGGVGQNVPKVRELGEPDSYEEKSTTIEAYGKMCSRRVSWENPTRVKRNPQWQRRKAKYTQGVWVGKSDPHEEKSIANEVQDKICPRHVSWKNPTCMKKNPSQGRHKAKCVPSACRKNPTSMKRNPPRRSPKAKYA